MRSDYIVYEKQVNGIYLSRMADGRDIFTAAEKATLLQIAMMCPQQAGLAPLKARTLYVQVTHTLLPQWTNCDKNVKAKEEVKSPVIDAVKVYPNPTKDILTVEAPLIADEATVWALTDLTGTVLQSAEMKSSVEIIDLRNFINGVYLLSVSRNGKMIGAEKVVIVR